MVSLSTTLPHCSPTQCTHCKSITMSSTSTVLEGVMQTVTVSGFLLCSTHIVPYTIPPPSDEDTTPLPDNTPLSPYCDLDVSLTTSNPLSPMQLPHPRWLVLSEDAGRQQHVRGWRTICIRDTRMYWQRSTTAVTLST